MASILGYINMMDREAFMDSVEKTIFWQGVKQYTASHQQEVNRIYQAFIQSEISIYSERYRLPAGGKLQLSNNLTVPAAVKLSGSYDVAYPLYDGRVAMGWDDVAFAYMTGDELDAHMVTVTQQDLNWVRDAILTALLNKTNGTFLDDRWGSLTIRRLANQDGTLYPPQRVAGTTTEAERNRYVGTNYTSASISDTNNPFAYARDELRKDFGRGNVVAFINSAQRAKTEALTNWVERPAMNVVYGALDNLASNPYANLPGEFIGSVNDVAVFIWDWIPADYLFAFDLDQPAPLKRRVDKIASLRGFGMVAKETEWPITTAFWRHREGYGVANRLNGVALFFAASTTYTNPTAYS